MRRDTVRDHLNAEVRDTLQHRQRQAMPVHRPAMKAQPGDAKVRLSTRCAPAAHDVFDPYRLGEDMGQAQPRDEVQRTMCQKFAARG